jgi:hypothetical protein
VLYTIVRTHQNLHIEINRSSFIRHQRKKENERRRKTNEEQETERKEKREKYIHRNMNEGENVRKGEI